MHRDGQQQPPQRRARDEQRLRVHRRHHARRQRQHVAPLAEGHRQPAAQPEDGVDVGVVVGEELQRANRQRRRARQPRRARAPGHRASSGTSARRRRRRRRSCQRDGGVVALRARPLARDARLARRQRRGPRRLVEHRIEREAARPRRVAIRGGRGVRLVVGSRELALARRPEVRVRVEDARGRRRAAGGGGGGGHELEVERRRRLVAHDAELVAEEGEARVEPAVRRRRRQQLVVVVDVEHDARAVVDGVDVADVLAAKVVPRQQLDDPVRQRLLRRRAEVDDVRLVPRLGQLVRRRRLLVAHDHDAPAAQRRTLLHRARRRVDGREDAPSRAARVGRRVRLVARQPLASEVQAARVAAHATHTVRLASGAAAAERGRHGGRRGPSYRVDRPAPEHEAGAECRAEREEAGRAPEDGVPRWHRPSAGG